MKKLLAVTLLLLSLAACEWHVQGEELVPGEDWYRYDYVFESTAEGYVGNKAYIKFNVGDDGAVDGEATGAFYTEFAGTLIDGTLELYGQYVSNACPEIPSRAWFGGIMAGTTLTGSWQVESCEVSELAYEGTLVGGRKYGSDDNTEEDQ